MADFLMTNAYYLCAAAFCFFIFAVFFDVKSLNRLFSRIDKKCWIFLFFIVIAAYFLRSFVVPHIHYVFYDEYEHLDIAKNMAAARVFARCNFFAKGQCLVYDMPQWVPGYHFLLSLMFKLFGTGDFVAYNFNVVLGTLSVVVIFLLTFLLTEKKSVALLAALLLSVLPIHLKYSGNSSPEMLSSLFMMLTVLASLIWMKNYSSRAIFLFLASFFYLLFIRPENGLIFLLLIPLIIKREPGKLFIFLVLLLPYVLFVPHIFRYTREVWLSGAGEVSVLSLLRSNLLLWAHTGKWPGILTFMAVAGTFMYKEGIKKTMWLWGFFFTFLLFYTLVHRVNMLDADFSRLSLQFAYPVVILASIGFYSGYKYLHKIINNISIAGLFCVTTCLSYGNSFPYLYDVVNFTCSQQEKSFNEAGAFDDSCIFIAYNPCMVISALGRPAIDMDLFRSSIYDQYLKDKCFVLVNDFWCKKDFKGCAGFIRQKYGLDIEKNGNSLFYRIK